MSGIATTPTPDRHTIQRDDGAPIATKLHLAVRIPVGGMWGLSPLPITGSMMQAIYAGISWWESV